MQGTNRLRYLVAVVRSGSIHEAAGSCGISGPSMSRAIKALERETGIALLVPDGRGVRPTPAAVELADFVEPLLGAIEDAVARTGDVARRAVAAPQRPLRIGAFEYCSTWLAPIVWDAATAPAGVELVEGGPGTLEELVVGGVIDLMVTQAPVPTDGVRFHGVDTKLEMGLFGRSDRFARLPLDELPFAAPMTMATRTGIGLRSLDGWPFEETARRVRYRVDLLETALAFSRAGRAVAWLPVALVHAHNALVRAAARLDRLPQVEPAPEHSQRLTVGYRSSDEPEAAWQLASRLGAAL